jgi:flavodoxin
MKSLIAYYSRTGSNEIIAKKLQEKLRCDIEKIIDMKNRDGASCLFIGGMEAMFKKMTKIRLVQKDPAGYELVIVASPIWAGALPPAIRTYISENKSKFKKIAFLLVSGNGDGNKKAVSDFESFAGKKATASLLLTSNEVKQERYKEKLESFVKHVLAK